jgi:hypothetical protein
MKRVNLEGYLEESQTAKINKEANDHSAHKCSKLSEEDLSKGQCSNKIVNSKRKYSNMAHQNDLDYSTHQSKKNTKKPKIPWRKEEDQIVIKLAPLFGCRKWKHIEKYLPNRTAKQCRERWCNQLNPQIKKVPWTYEEDLVIYLLHAMRGNGWKEISKELPGRSENAIKNHWNAAFKTNHTLIKRFHSEIESKMQGSDITNINAFYDEMLSHAIENVSKKQLNCKLIEDKNGSAKKASHVKQFSEKKASNFLESIDINFVTPMKCPIPSEYNSLSNASYLSLDNENIRTPMGHSTQKYSNEKGISSVHKYTVKSHISTNSDSSLNTRSRSLNASRTPTSSAAQHNYLIITSN